MDEFVKRPNPGNQPGNGPDRYQPATNQTRPDRYGAQPESTHQNSEDPQPKKNKKGKKAKKVLLILLVLLLIAGSGAGAYFWQQSEVTNYSEQASLLQNENISLQAQLASAQEENNNQNQAVAGITAEQIETAVTEADYASLQPHLADTVFVVLAASEGLGNRTPEQVVGDLQYLSDAVAPWNFEMTDEQLAEWRAGDYGSYLPNSAVIGLSTNNYVVSFQFNSSGKISTIFMTGTTDVL